jgi:hypothetical protein
VTRHLLEPEPEKSVILAHDGSWRMHLEPCHPEDLPVQVERLAERSLTHGSDTDRDEAYWCADDTIREAYRLPQCSAQEDREKGFTGWLSSRLELVRVGWRKLVERSVALASRIGDPLASIEAEDQIRNTRHAGERWSAIGRLEREIQTEQPAHHEAPKPSRKPRGLTR